MGGQKEDVMTREPLIHYCDEVVWAVVCETVWAEVKWTQKYVGFCLDHTRHSEWLVE
jgi:hypothetical protein